MSSALPDRSLFAKVRSAFGEALDREPADREPWLREHLAHEPAVLTEVLSLLERSGESAPSVGDAQPRRGSASHPTELGPYRVLSLLGEGGMGAVYEAEQRNPHRRVALKVIRTALASDEVRRRFELEGEVLGHLRHPAIAQVYETGTAELAEGVEVPYLAMEQVVGASTLSEHVRAAQPDMVRRLELFCAIVDGVEHAHQRGIVHRDLKPANILVDSEGLPKIIDFGLARAVDESSDLLSMHTRTGQIMGTPTYMSPEQFSGRPDAVGLGSDVYSLGVMLFELVTGELPHELSGLSVVEMARVVREEPARSMANTETRVRDDLDTIVAKALEKQVERRYGSAAALAADLRRYLRHEPILARPASTLYQARMFARRHRALVISAALVLLMALVATAVSISYALDASQRADEAERASYRSQMLAAVGELGDRNVLAAAELLRDTPERLRGWEHRHLESRLRPGLPLPEALPQQMTLLQGAEFGETIMLGLSGPDGVAIEVWDPRTWERLLSVPPEAHRINQSALSPMGTHLARVSSESHRLLAWEVASARRLVDVPLDDLEQPVAVSWSDDGRTLQVSSVRRRETRDGRTGALLETDDYPEHEVHLVFPDSPWRMAVDGAGIRLTKGEANDIVDALRGDSVVDLATVAKPRSFLGAAVSRHDGSVQLVEVRDGELVEVWRRELDTGYVTHFGWGPGQRLMAVGTSQGTLHVWEQATGRTVRRFDLEGAISGVAFFGDGRELLVCNQTGHTWRLPTDPPSDVVSVPSFVYPVVLDDPSGLVLSGSWDGNEGVSGALRLWDLASGALVASYGDPGDVIYSADLSPDGRHAVLGVLRKGWDASTRVLDLVTGEVSRRGPYVLSKPSRVRVHPDGRRVLSSFSSGFSVVWDLASGERLWSSLQGDPTNEALLRQSADGLAAATFSPDGRVLAQAHQGTQIRLVDARTYADMRSWPAHDDSIWSLSFSPDGKWLLSTSIDDTVGVWDVATGALVARLVGHGSDVFSAAVSPDGTRIATGGRDRLLRFWDTERFENVASLSGHAAYIYSVVWSADGERIVTGGGAGELRTWELQGDGWRARAARERDAMLPRLEQHVRRLRDESADFTAVRRALLEDAGLTTRERQVALQLAVSLAVDEATARTADEPRDERFGGPVPSASVLLEESQSSFHMALHGDGG